MNNTAVTSILFLLVVIGSARCNGANETQSSNGTNVTNETPSGNGYNKTKLFIPVLERRRRRPASTELGIQLAIAVAKNSSHFKDFLDKYEIETKSYYTKSKETNAISTATYLLRYIEDGYALLLLGPQTAAEASSVLKVVRFYRKFMVTYLTTSSEVKELEDPYGFTFAPSAFTFNKAVISIMNSFKWKRAAVVYDFLDDGGLYVKAVDNLLQYADFKIIGVEAINTGVISLKRNISKDIQGQLQKLKDLDSKIFFGAFNARGASLVFCNLYKMKMYGPEFVWILHPNAGTVDDWDGFAEVERKKNKSETCTKKQYEEVADRTIMLDKNILYQTDESTTTASGLSLRQAFNREDAESMTETEKIEFTTAFDTMWAIMLALKEASTSLPSSLPLEYNVQNFIGKDKITETIESKLRNLSFEGLTGPISFTGKEEREGKIGVKQYRTSEKSARQIGQHFTKDDRFVLYNNTDLWKDGQIPYDRSQKKLVPQTVAIELFIVFSTTASIGIVLGIMFLIFNRYYRKYRFIRMSAPLFNDVMVLGCIMCLSTVYLFGLRNFGDPEINMPPICKARAWILNVGFSLAFGAMFIKTWRIYKICTNKRLKVRLGPLSDWWMLTMVSGIVLIDVGIMVAWEIEDPLEWAQHNFTEERDKDNPLFIIVPTLNTCTAKNLTIWLALIYVYKGIMLLYGLFLAYETRNVVYAHLNDSRVIGICVYNVVVLSTIGAFLALILNNDQYEQLYAALSVCIIFPASVTILLIFIPKLIHRIKMSSLDDEAGESATNTRTFTRPSIDITSTCGYATEMGRERYIDASSTNGSVNTLCVYQNGDAGLSPASSPKPPTKLQELSPRALED